jgi:hypothetical protein
MADDYVRAGRLRPAKIRSVSHRPDCPTPSRPVLARRLRLLSAQNPKLLYPYFDTLAEMLAGKNTILGWNSAWIVGNLAAVDHEHRIDKSCAAPSRRSPEPK